MKTKRLENETDLAYDVRQDSAYWLGPVVRVHRVGEYQFLEHRTRIAEGVKLTRRLEPESKNSFSIYIGERSIGRGAYSLDEALVTAIAYKRDGCNSQAASFFMKMTEPTPSPNR